MHDADVRRAAGARSGWGHEHPDAGHPDLAAGGRAPRAARRPGRGAARRVAARRPGRGRRDRPGARGHRRDERGLRRVAAGSANCVVVGRPAGRRGAGRRLRRPRRHPGRRQQPGQADPRRPQGVVPGDGPRGRGVRDGVRRDHAVRPARRRGGCWSTSGCSTSTSPCVGSGVRRSKLLLPGRLLARAARAPRSSPTWPARSAEPGPVARAAGPECGGGLVPRPHTSAAGPALPAHSAGWGPGARTWSRARLSPRPPRRPATARAPRPRCRRGR